MVLILCNEAPEAHLIEPIGEQSTTARITNFAREIARDLTVVVYTSEELRDLPTSWRVVHSPSLTEDGLLAILREETTAAETVLVVARLDHPFLSTELTRRTVERHREFRAEYTFSDGYPIGLGAEVVAGRAIRHLEELVKPETRLERVPLFEIVQRDTNRLDVETILSDVDNRLLRLSLSVAERPDLVLCKRFAANEPGTLEEWESRAAGSVAEHRTLPRFVSIQVVEQEVHSVAYSPYPTLRTNVTEAGRIISLEAFAGLIDDLEQLSPNAWVHLSLWGEIALHPQPVELVRRVLASPGLRLLVETSGIGWEGARQEELFAINDPRMLLVTGLDTNDSETYRRVRGEGFQIAQSFARASIEALGERAHVQAVRSEMTEPTLDAFYTEWKKVTDNVVIQKYDHFSGALPKIKIGDVSPINRFPCWHLQRDLHVLVDGTVPLCREDLHAETVMGNALSGSLENCWASGTSRFEEHTAGEYSGVCAECDEYYVFSF